MSHLSYSGRIARPSFIAQPAAQPKKTTTTTTISSTNNGSKKKQINQVDSCLSKSHSMHRLLKDDPVEKPMHRKALLSRATTAPMPRPSSLIKRFSDHTAMKRCTVSMNSPLQQQNTNSSSSRSSRSSNSSNSSNSNSSGVHSKHDFKLGQKVCVPTLNVVGTVKYFGQTKFKEKGVWVGIELDLLGTGKNDGSIQGVRYFSCAPNTGLFVLAAKVTAALVEEVPSRKKITPCPSKTTTAKRSQSALSVKRKSMILTSSTTTNCSSSSTSTSTTRQTATPKRHQSATTANTRLNPSKSARTLSTRSSSSSANAPLPTRSTPSGATKKTSTSTKTSKPALKKSSSMSTTRSDCHRASSPQQQRQIKRHTADIELERLHALLEKSRQEKQALSQQMDGQEAAWERLVCAKESYAVRVQEKDDEIARLKRLLDNSSQAPHDLAKMATERDSALSRASMSEAIEKQHSKVIERLDLRIRTLQQQQQTQLQQYEAAQNDYSANMSQVRKQLAERDEATAMVERECSEIRQDHAEAMKAFETAMERREREYTATVANKDAHIAKLQQMVNDLMYPSAALPIVEGDSTRRRLEAQLELTTSELDKERERIQAQAVDLAQLRDEIKRLHRASVCSSTDFYKLRSDLEHEIEDKRRIMEEANAALEVQAKLEEENERIKLTNEKTQRDLADVLRKLASTEKERGSAADLLANCSQLEAENERLQLQQKQTEHECMRLMDELLAIEKVESVVAAGADRNDDKMNLREIEQLRLQVNREVQRYQDLEQSKEVKIHKLYKELSDLESLVENKVFNEAELEEAIACEKRKVSMLEGRLREVEEKNRTLSIHPPLSPTSPQYSLFRPQKRCSTGSMMTSMSMDTVSDHGDLLESVYCEICEEYGHEVLTCNAYQQQTVSAVEEDQSSYYCVNCDVFNIHPTEECPNQDEMF